MPISKADLAGLALLQEQDRLVDSLDAALKLIPKDVAALRGELKGEHDRLAAHKDKVVQLQLRKKEKELELGKQEELVRKHTSDLNQVKTNEAFKALQLEIESAKALAGDVETAILEIMEEADALAGEEKALKADLARAEADVQARVAVLEARAKEAEVRLAAEKSKREGMAQGLPADMLSLYDRTRQRRQGIGLSRVKGNVCEACRMTLTPQALINVMKASSLVLCESCQRILYNPEPAAAAKPAA